MSIRKIGAVISCMCLALLAVMPGARGVSAATHTNARPAAMVIHAGFLTVGSDTTYPPMESKDPTSLKFVGADVDLANALAHAMGLKGAVIVSNTFDTLIPVMLTRHKFDVIMSSMNDRPDRRKQGVNFVDYMRASESILVKKSSSIHANSYAGMCGHTVSVERGTTEQDGLTAANKTCKNKINIKLFAQDTDAYNAFAAGHADAYSSDYPVVANYIRAQPGKYRTAGTAFGATEDYGIAVPKTNGPLLTSITKAFHTIRMNGQYLRILKRWDVQGAAI